MIIVYRKNVCCPECNKKIELNHVVEASQEELDNEVSNHDVIVNKKGKKINFEEGIDGKELEKWKQIKEIYEEDEEEEE